MVDIRAGNMNLFPIQIDLFIFYKKLIHSFSVN